MATASAMRGPPAQGGAFAMRAMVALTALTATTATGELSVCRSAMAAGGILARAMGSAQAVSRAQVSAPATEAITARTAHPSVPVRDSSHSESVQGMAPAPTARWATAAVAVGTDTLALAARACAPGAAGPTQPRACQSVTSAGSPTVQSARGRRAASVLTVRLAAASASAAPPSSAPTAPASAPAPLYRATVLATAAACAQTAQQVQVSAAAWMASEGTNASWSPSACASLLPWTSRRRNGYSTA